MPAIPGLNPAQVIILSLLFLGGGEAYSLSFARYKGCPILTTFSSRESHVVSVSTCTSDKVVRLAFEFM